MTLVVGITGGIGSGKSTLTKYVESMGYKVQDSDKEISLFYKKPTKKLKKILIEVGLKKSIKKNHIDKKIISSSFFENKKTKIKLESFLHLEIKKKRNFFIKHHRRKKEKIIFLDIPLLFENNLDNLFDIIICVISNKLNRQHRVKKIKNIAKKTFEHIVNNQTTDVERKKRSDYVIINNGTKKNFIKRADRVINNILK